MLLDEDERLRDRMGGGKGWREAVAQGGAGVGFGQKRVGQGVKVDTKTCARAAPWMTACALRQAAKQSKAKSTSDHQRTTHGVFVKWT